MKAQCAFEECSADRYASLATRTIPKIAAAPSQFHRPSALWAIGRSPHMLNSVSQMACHIAWRIVGRRPLRTYSPPMRPTYANRRTNRRETDPSLFVRLPRLGSMCCKVENKPAADVILKIISRGLTTTRPAFVNEHIFFFFAPTQAFILQASRPFGFLKDCKDLLQESCRCAKTKRGSER